MKIIVSGGAGMIGSSLCKSLSKLNHQIYVIDNLFRGNYDYIKDYVSNKNFFNCDLSKHEEIEKLSKIDEIKNADLFIHLADIVAGISYVFDNEFLDWIFENHPK